MFKKLKEQKEKILMEDAKKMAGKIETLSAIVNSTKNRFDRIYIHLCDNISINSYELIGSHLYIKRNYKLTGSINEKYQFAIEDILIKKYNLKVTGYIGTKYPNNFIIYFYNKESETEEETKPSLIDQLVKSSYEFNKKDFQDIPNQIEGIKNRLMERAKLGYTNCSISVITKEFTLDTDADYSIYCDNTSNLTTFKYIIRNLLEKEGLTCTGYFDTIEVSWSNNLMEKILKEHNVSWDLEKQ